MTSPRIAIIGGGPAGLVLLNVLARNNVSATLFERDEEFSARGKLGGSLDLHPKSGQAALKAAGVWGEFEKAARPEGQAMTLVNHKGETVFAYTPPPDEVFHARPEIDRTALRKILVDAAPESSIKWGHAFVSASPVAGTSEWELTFANGHKAVVDLLVGADGGRSRVRPLVSDAAVTYTRCNGIEISWDASTHPELAGRVGPGAVYAFDNFRGLYAQRGGEGRIRAYCWVLSDDEEEYVRMAAEPARAVATLLAHFDSWEPWITELVRVGQLESVVPRSLYMLPVGHSWAHRDGVTLIGDAAYLMTPFAGKGANVAMLSALKLGEAI
ncbi:FAD/NAD(P)-binding domain-containing protein, partial [Auricularia subglabra TFB-10046 SS5]